MKTGIRFFTAILISFLLMLTAGCFGLGPRVLPGNRVAYNRSLQSSESEQLLLNIVRMRYDESPYFLGVSNIAATMRINGGILGTWQNTTGAGIPASDQLTAAGDVNYEDRPVISYAPLQGADFTRQLLTPISLVDIDLLMQSGWNFSRVLRVTTQSLNGIPNAPTASRPSTNQLPEYQDFKRLSHIARVLEDNNVLDVILTKYEKNNEALKVVIKNPRGHQAEINQMYAMLHIKGAPKTFLIIPATEVHHIPNSIPIETRSFMGVLYYLSKSVVVLPSEIEKGVVAVPSYPDGEAFDWTDVTKGLMRIYSSGTRPSNADVAVFYRGRWFYIADNDNNSKQTLALLEQLFYLHAVGANQPGPVLTLPV